MKPGNGLREPLVVARQASEARRPGEAALHYPPARQEHEALLGAGVLDHLQSDAARFRRFCRLLARVALVHIRQLNALARVLLHGSRQLFDLRAVLFGGGRDAQGEQVPESIHGGMYLRAFLALRPVVAGPVPALRAGGQAQDGPQVVNHRLEDSGVDPALGLLVDGLPRREVVWHHAPRGSGSHYPAQGIEDLAQVVDALRGVFAEQREVGGDERPLFVAHVGRVRLSVRHGGMLPSRPRKFITRSRVLPRWCGVLFILLMPVTIFFGSILPSAYSTIWSGLAWLALGYGLGSHSGTAAEQHVRVR